MNTRICATLVLDGHCVSVHGHWRPMHADAGPATPRTADGHPDFNGTWDNGGGIDFLNPQKLPDGSVCVTGLSAARGSDCGRGRRRPRARPPPDRAALQAAVRGQGQ